MALVDKSLATSLHHTYHLYYYLLDLIRALAIYQRELSEIRERRFLKLSDGVTPRGLSDITLAKEIARYTEIQNPLDRVQRCWEQGEQLFRALYNMAETDPPYSVLPEDVPTLSMQEQRDHQGDLLKQFFRIVELNEHLAANSFHWADAAVICERLEVEKMPTVDQMKVTVERLKGSDDYHVISFTNQPMVTVQDFALRTLRRGAKDSLELPGDLLSMFHSDRGRLYTYQLLSETFLHHEECDAMLTS